jgi:hypothetical protein
MRGADGARAAVLAAAVTLACGNKGMTTMTKNDEPVIRLKQHLANARQQSYAYIGPEALPERSAVLEIVASDARPWWDSLSPEESCLLLEISPTVAERAPAATRAHAYCAGLSSISAEWWGLPTGPDTETTQRLVQLGKAAAPCLREAMQSTKPLQYLDGEANAMAQSYGWSVGDLAAAIAAHVLSVPYDANASADARAARRSELAGLLR